VDTYLCDKEPQATRHQMVGLAHDLGSFLSANLPSWYRIGEVYTTFSQTLSDKKVTPKVIIRIQEFSTRIHSICLLYDKNDLEIIGTAKYSKTGLSLPGKVAILPEPNFRGGRLYYHFGQNNKVPRFEKRKERTA
jgi:hypothetical protein